MKTTKSDELYERACKHMPGGVNSPVRSFRSVGMKPLFIESAHGDRVTDVDGNEFIDYVCSWGPNILGHSNTAVIEAVKKRCDSGLTFGACHAGEIELAEEIKKSFSSMEMLRLVNSGTEAVMSAVRTARGYTGRNRIIKFEGCYHGHSDGLLVKGGSGLMTASLPDSGGVPKSCVEDTLTARYNDRNSVEEIFQKYGEEIACVVVEPCAANMGVVPPERGFLEYLAKITHEYGGVLVFDEVITGYRLSIGGAQEYFKVTPDMTVLGKIVGGGMPLAVYGGKREIMECVAPCGDVYQAGTLSGNPIAVAAGLATLREIRSREGMYDELERKGAKLEKAVKAAGLNVNRCGSIMTVFFTQERVRDFDSAKTADTKEYAKFFKYLLKNGIYTAPSQFEAMFISASHTDKDIEYTCKVIENYANQM